MMTWAVLKLFCFLFGHTWFDAGLIERDRGNQKRAAYCRACGTWGRVVVTELERT